METLKTLKKKAKGINYEALDKLIEKQRRIKQILSEGKEIDPEITKNFVTFPISIHSFERE